MKLTDLECRNAKPGTKPIKLIDGKGLYLLITPNGCKSWRLKYRLNQKEQLFTIGRYPQYGLSAARAEVEDARALVKQGINPTDERKRKRLEKAKAASNTYEVIAREWLGKFHNRGTKYDNQVLSRHENDIFPVIGKMPIADVKPINILEAVERVARRGAIESAHRLLQKCSQICRYAVQKDFVTRDICRDLKGALPPVPDVEHHAAITDPDELAGLLISIDSYSGSLLTILALQLAPLVFLRPGALRKAEWKEFDLANARWDIPMERMKKKSRKKKSKAKADKIVSVAKKKSTTHIVPLPHQAVTILKELETFTGGGRYVFPCTRSAERMMSENTLNAALRRLGYSNEEATSHGFRATARTILVEVLGVRVDLIEHQLGHIVKDPNGRAYDRTTFLPHREQMMQLWADYLDSLKNGEDFVLDEERYKLCRKQEY